MKTKNLSILIVENDEKYQEKLKTVLDAMLPEYMKQYAYVKSHQELEERVQMKQYDVALVDFSLDNDAELWRTDAAYSAMILDRSQPGCMRIGLSSVPTMYTEQFKDVYACIIGKNDFDLKDKLKNKLEKIVQ